MKEDLENSFVILIWKRNFSLPARWWVVPFGNQIEDRWYPRCEEWYPWVSLLSFAIVDFDGCESQSKLASEACLPRISGEEDGCVWKYLQILYLMRSMMYLCRGLCDDREKRRLPGWWLWTSPHQHPADRERLSTDWNWQFETTKMRNLTSCIGSHEVWMTSWNCRFWERSCLWQESAWRKVHGYSKEEKAKCVGASGANTFRWGWFKIKVLAIPLFVLMMTLFQLECLQLKSSANSTMIVKSFESREGL